MVDYKLLTPGPLTTTKSVKTAMLTDHCTWDEDYKSITRKLQDKLLEIGHCDKSEYACVFMQGSGSFGVESVLGSVVGDADKLLILINGTYGKRMAEIATYAKIPFITYEIADSQIHDEVELQRILDENGEVTHVAMVHSETTTGMLNPLEKIAKIVKKNNKSFIVDAMSSFGGIDINVQELGIDFIVSSANKCIQGVPGFSFILCRRKVLMESKGKARSLALSLLDQYETMEKDGKWRFTSPTHVVLAFEQAIKEFEEEGGVIARNKRYEKCNKAIIAGMTQMGFTTYLSDNQGPIITTYIFPENKEYDFEEFYNYVKARGYALYPGKVTEKNAFRIGNIGDITIDDVDKLLEIIGSYIEGK